MKTVEVIGYKRANLGKAESKRLREEGFVPCVMYGGEEQIHFYSPTILFRDVVYTADAHFVELNIEGDIHRTILQDIQFHPVSDALIHLDFLEIFKGIPVKMSIPVHLEGNAPGVQQGGKILRKIKYLTVKGLPKNMPDYIKADISELNLGQAIKVRDVEAGDFEILTPERITLATLEVPRVLRETVADEDGEGEEGEEGVEGEEGAEGATDGADTPKEGGDAGNEG